MNSRPPHHSSLPPRPSFATPTPTAAGPSRAFQPLPQVYHAPPSQPQASYYQYQPQVQQNLSGGYPVGGFYGGFYGATPGPSFGQSLFRPVPTANPEGYSYSQTYLTPPSHATPSDPPQAKRQKPNPIAAVSQGVKPWRNCSHPGCKFVGSGDEVEVHEGDRHLIFPAGRVVERSEEEERFAKRKGPLPPIQGTNITLNTPEDIEKWIAERKARWPSSKRMQEKEEERKAAIARGEIPANGKRRGKPSNPAAMAEEWGREVKEYDGEARGGWERGRGRGLGRGGREERGRGRGGARGRGRGGGWTDGREGHGAPETPVAASIPAPEDAPEASGSAAGLAGLGGYDTSSDSSFSSDSSSSESDSDSDSDSSSGFEAESEVDGHKPPPPTSTPLLGDDLQTEQQQPTELEVTSAPVPAQPADTRPLCRFFAQHGKCKHGAKCHFSHGPQSATSGPSSQAAAGQEKKKAPRQPAAKKPNPFARPSMLGSLLANPIQNTISQLSQTIRFLVANDMLEGVELKPGDAEAQERERNKVAVVSEKSSLVQEVDAGEGSKITQASPEKRGSETEENVGKEGKQ
ncbi:hypothetical protein IAT38_007446 [Cryptococcus sp. DSM 104549]